MFKYATRVLNSHVRFHLSNKAFSPKNFSVLYPVNHKIGLVNNRKKLTFLSSNSTNNTQYVRNLSLLDIQSMSLQFYNFVSTSEASKLVYNYIIQAHDITGLPWWGTIVLVAGTIKLCVAFPAGIYQQHLIATLINTKAELAPVVEKLKQEILVQGKREKWTKKKATLVLAREVKKHANQLIVERNCHPFKTVILGLMQVPLWVVMSITFRKLSYDVITGHFGSELAAFQFQMEGPIWCANLALPDSTLILPTLICLLSLISVEVNTCSPTHVISFMSKLVVIFFRCLAVFSFYISSIMPSAVSLFWVSTLVLGLGQNLIFMSPTVRRFLRIPKTKVHPDKPYKFLVEKFKEKWFKKPKRD